MEGHLGISVSKLCFKNGLGLLINNRSNFREERIIVRKMAATFREERIIARKFGMNHRAKRIIIRKIARIKTIGVTKMQGNFVEISFQAKSLRKARNFIKICLHYFFTILYVSVQQAVGNFSSVFAIWMQKWLGQSSRSDEHVPLSH